MQQFQVPQFITIEDKIIGPLTLKQFMYLLGAIAVALITYFLFHFVLFLIIGLPIIGLMLAMAFGKVNGRPFPTVFYNGLNYYMKPHLYLWQKGKADGGKRGAKSVQPHERPEESPLAGIPKLSASKLSDLAWSLDVKEKIGDRE